MIRKFSAAIFILVMALLITLKHPVLGYCLCLNTYFTGDCVCKIEHKAPSASQKKDPVDLPDCCSSCDLAANQESPPSDPSSPPCDDCTEHFSIDVGDFVWSSPNEVPSDTETFTPVSFAKYDHLGAFSNPFNNLPYPYWESPPEVTFHQSTPLYLRHSVLRL